MARKPIWQDPDIRRNHNETAREEIGALLQARNLVHLDVYSRGDHVVIHSFDQGEKISRIRFTRIGMDRDGDRYELGIASHTGAGSRPRSRGRSQSYSALSATSSPGFLRTTKSSRSLGGTYATMY